MTTIPRAERAHREAFMQFCISYAEPQHRAILTVLYTHFEQWNHDFFENTLSPPHFLILNPKVASAEGDYASVSGWGSHSQIRIRPSLIDGTHPHLRRGSRDEEGIQRYWLDTALHEVVHQYCHEVLGKPEAAEKGHGRIYAGECSRIGAMLGLPPVGPARKTQNHGGLPSCGLWPTIVRQPSEIAYYLGAYRPDLDAAAKAQKAAHTRPRHQPMPTEAEMDALMEVLAHGLPEPLFPPPASPPHPTNPLTAREWDTLLAVRDARIRPLILKLAAHLHILPSAETPAPVMDDAPVPDAALDPPSQPIPSPRSTPTVILPEPPKAAPSRATAFVPSHYQQAVFDWIEQGTGDALVNACAGSGKTTTLVEAAHRLPRETSALFLAFNKHIAEALQERLKGTRMVAKTIHSIGHGCLLKHLGTLQKVNDRKYRKLIEDVVKAKRWQPEQAFAATHTLPQLVNFTRLTLTDPHDPQAMRAMIDHFGIEIDPLYEDAMISVVPTVLEAGAEQARNAKIIDFTDMIWLPNLWQLQPPTLDFIFVDEAQDLNVAQRELVLKCRAPGGRMLWVGDPNQSIMAFAGADSESFWRIKTATNATELPLSICYRCPTRHLELARAIVPHIEAREGAPEGSIRTIREADLVPQVQAGDLILCRLTAPLVALCITLIENRIPAQVKGRNIGTSLTTVIEAVAAQPGFRYERFGTFLNQYADEQVRKLSRREGNEAKIQNLMDRVEAVRACHDASEATTATQLATELESLFSDTGAMVTLSTVHRAKGLENDRVFLLYPEETMPLIWPKQQDWELEQELNIRYVALTRAKRELFMVARPLKKQRNGDTDRWVYAAEPV